MTKTEKMELEIESLRLALDELLAMSGDLLPNHVVSRIRFRLYEDFKQFKQRADDCPNLMPMADAPLPVETKPTGPMKCINCDGKGHVYGFWDTFRRVDECGVCHGSGVINGG